MEKTLAWIDAGTALSKPFFDGVRPLLKTLDRREWPGLATLNVIAAEREIVNANGVPLRFVPPAAAGMSAMHYETSIAETGEVPTRENWHDLFNALQWLAFPRLKGAINARHARQLAMGGAVEASARSPARDVLTMFDESGIIVVSEDETLLELIRNFQWRELFVVRRDDVVAKMRFILVGHGLMEKALSPFIGLTAKAMLLNERADADSLDEAAARWLLDDTHLGNAHMLAPLPLLGIPGWDARNESVSFYDDAHYFRLGRRGKKTGA